MLKLLSATPSPFARKVRVVLLEKKVPFELITVNPWNLTSDVERVNPLGKIPVLIPDNEETIYESSFIIEWLEVNYPKPALIPSNPAEALHSKKIQVLADGICEAFILLFFEQLRAEALQSKPWADRQLKKIENGLTALEQLMPNNGFCVGNRFTIADIAVVALADYFSLRFKEYNWQSKFKKMSALVARQSGRLSFLETMPSAQHIEKNTI